MRLAIRLSRWRLVSEWRDRGYRGLSIPGCPNCDARTERTWADLGAQGDDDIGVVALRLRCGTCQTSPVGVTVYVYAEPKAANGQPFDPSGLL